MFQEIDDNMYILLNNVAGVKLIEENGKYHWLFYTNYHPSGYVHPKAIQVMKEDGIDISDQYSKHISEIPINQVDYVITLCGDAAENCPVVPGANTQHWNLPDPARVIGPTEDAKLNAFRNVRDEIKKRVEQLIKNL